MRLGRLSLVMVLAGSLFAGVCLQADEGARKAGPKDEGKASAEGERDAKPKLSRSQRKSQRIFKAYDKDKDGKVTFEEWLKMKEGAMDDARKAREKKWFDQADADKNGSVSVDEFHQWLNRKPRREGPRKGPADNPNAKKAE